MVHADWIGLPSIRLRMNFVTS